METNAFRRDRDDHQKRVGTGQASRAQDCDAGLGRAAKDTGLKPVIAVADLVFSQLDQIINFAKNPVINAGEEDINLKNRSCDTSVALREAQNGVSYSVASCALPLGHSCGFQGTKWVACKDNSK